MTEVKSQFSVDDEAGDPPDLLNELARAMHDAAATQFVRTTAELERHRLQQVDAVAKRASADADDLTAELDADIRAIDAWAKAEAEKVKLERMQRIDTRRAEHADMLQREATIKEREILAIEVAIDAHRAELDIFFRDLGQATDPSQIATVAAAMPSLPPLAEIAEDARRAATSEFSLRDRSGDVPARPVAQDEADVSSSRLMAVMEAPAAETAANGLDRTWSSPDARPWESATPAEVPPTEPAEGSPATGSTDPGVPAEAASPSAVHEPEPAASGSTLLRAIASFRPMASSSNHSSEPNDRDR